VIADHAKDQHQKKTMETIFGRIAVKELWNGQQLQPSGSPIAKSEIGSSTGMLLSQEFGGM